MKNSAQSADFSPPGASCCGTLTLQNTWLTKTEGSKKLQKRWQTQHAHLLVSSPINTWRPPEREEALTTCSDGVCSAEHTAISLGAYSQNGDAASRPFAQQLVQLFPGDGVGDEAEDEEGGEDDGQSPAQKRVHTDAFVVRHISSACKQMESWFNTRWYAAASYLLCANTLLFIGSQMPPFSSSTWMSFRVANANLSFSNLLLMVEQMRSESFSSWSRVFCTAWLMVFSMVWHTLSIWFTQRLGYKKDKKWSWMQPKDVSVKGLSIILTVKTFKKIECNWHL